MEMVSHPSWIEIDLSQFQKNLKAIRKKIGSALFCLPVKANGYGHGLLEIAKMAVESGVDCLGVSCLQEGMRLRRAKVIIPILVLGAIHEEQMRELIAFDLECSVSSRYKAEKLLSLCQKMGKECHIHLEIDTGMQRTGVRLESAFSLLHWIDQHPLLKLKGIYSHLATADRAKDSFAMKQIEMFSQLRERVKRKEIIWHLANSGGVLYYPESHFDMVRPGLLSYGYLPRGEKDPEIRPCFSIRSKVSYFKVVGEDLGIGYGHLYRTKKQARVITVPIGYGDGYLRAFSNRAPILLRGKKYKISGAICMDQFMVDIGEDEGYVGDVATLLGRDQEEEITLDELAKIASTIPYELLTLLNDRLPRKYFVSV